jgi:hypothetical protein
MVPSGNSIPPDHKFDKQQAALLEPNVPDIKPAPLPDDLADFQLAAQVKKLSDHDLEFIVRFITIALPYLLIYCQVNKYSVRRGVRIDHDHAGERAYDDAIVFETPLKVSASRKNAVKQLPLKYACQDRFNEDHLESGVTTRTYSTGREAEMACQGYSSLKGGVKAEMFVMFSYPCGHTKSLGQGQIQRLDVGLRGLCHRAEDDRDIHRLESLILSRAPLL